MVVVHGQHTSEMAYTPKMEVCNACTVHGIVESHCSSTSKSLFQATKKKDLTQELAQSSRETSFNESEAVSGCQALQGHLHLLRLNSLLGSGNRFVSHAHANLLLMFQKKSGNATEKRHSVKGGTRDNQAVRLL